MYTINSFRKFILNTSIAILVFYFLDFFLEGLNTEIKALLNLVSFSTSFFISLLIYYRHKNIFIPAVLAVYSFAIVIEIQSELYAYTDTSYALWNIGNLLILCGFSWELIKMCRK